MSLWTLARSRLERVDVPGDRGMTVIEAIVALSILGLVGSGFAVGMNQTLLVTQDDRIRQQATHVAERELEIARNRFQHADENGQLGALTEGTVVNDEPLPGQTSGQPIRIDGRDFTVSRTQHLITNGNGANPCEGGSTVTYLSLGITVVVSWFANGTDHSVENRTILTPQKGVEGDAGYLAAKVTNASGGPVNGLAVSASGPGGTKTATTVDGCAVFLFQTAGTYDLSLNQNGYTNFEGFQQVTKGAVLEVGKLKVLPFTYDRAASANVTYRTASGHDLPQTLPGLTFFNSGLVAGRRQIAATTSPVSVDGLWPFTDGYTVWAGTCDQSDPGLNDSGYPRPDAIQIAGGATAAVDVYLAPVTVRVVDNDGDPVSGVPVNAVPLSAAGCVGADGSLVLGATGGDGRLASSLSAGSWQLSPASPFNCLAEDDSVCPVETGNLAVVTSTGGAPTDVVTLPDLEVEGP